MAHPNRGEESLKRMAMGASLAVAVLMLAGKFAAYEMTGSMAILSDAAESVVHIFATAFAAWSLWYAEHSADPEHPYGHGKMAYFSAGFEGALIFMAALYIYYAAISALIAGPEVQQLGLGLAITAGLAAVNAALGGFLVYVGKTRNAVVLIANGHHVLSDMWTSIGVVIGVALVWFTGILWLDPVVAILAATQIVISGLGLLRGSVRGLLDRADPEHTEKILAALRGAIARGTISDFHHLRHRASNDVIYVEAHMLVPGDWNVESAHDRVTQVETELRALFPKYHMHITTHIEPLLHDKAHPRGEENLDDVFGNCEDERPGV